MTTRQFILFISGLIVPALYQRLKFIYFHESFYRTELRDMSGLNIHHGHWGALMAFVSMLMLVFGLHNWLSIGLAGFGWGLVLDEIVPMLKMPSSGDRDKELDVYAKSEIGTILLIGAAVTIATLMFLVHR